MTFEWLIVSLLLAAALAAVGRRLGTTTGWILLLVFYAMALGAAGLWQGAVRKKEKARAALVDVTPRQQRPGGYISSDNCRSCHPDQYATWHRSYHRTMTQLPSAESVRGNFNNVTLELPGETYRLERRGDDFRVNDKRVTLLTGSHHMQTYWVAADQGNRQQSFPFTFLFEENRWVPRDATFLTHRQTKFGQHNWNTSCGNCHATAIQARQDVATKIFDSRVAELGIACEACHGPSEEHVQANRDPKRRYTLHRTGKADPTIFNPGRVDRLKSADACGQCHAIRARNPQDDYNMLGLLYRPGGELQAHAPFIGYHGADLDAPGNEAKRAVMEGSFWSDGQVRVSGREFNGLALTSCFTRGEMSCVSCHSMHKYQNTDDQLAPGMESNAACIQCHKSFAAKIEEHTHHRGDSSGSLCYNCHMPHTTYGLLKAIRSHTVDSPSIKTSIATGRPNACNLCHLDKTLDWTGRKLEEWYRQPLPKLNEEQKSTSAAVTWLLKGDAGQRAIMAWHMSWEPAKRISGESWMAPHLAQLLEDPYAVVRYIAQRSLKRLPGYEKFAYDYVGPAENRKRGREGALEMWRGQAKAQATTNEAVLVTRDGRLQEQKVTELLKQRDDRPMDLLE